MSPNSPELHRPNSLFQNAEKSFALASALFPGEEWVFKEPGIWVAKSRLPEEYKEPDKWEREMCCPAAPDSSEFCYAKLQPNYSGEFAKQTPRQKAVGFLSGKRGVFFAGKTHTWKERQTVCRFGHGRCYFGNENHFGDTGNSGRGFPLGL
jgi:hypothetical protein